MVKADIVRAMTVVRFVKKFFWTNSGRRFVDKRHWVGDRKTNDYVVFDLGLILLLLLLLFYLVFFQFKIQI